jgi:hypothetical protein
MSSSGSTHRRPRFNPSTYHIYRVHDLHATLRALAEVLSSPQPNGCPVEIIGLICVEAESSRDPTRERLAYGERRDFALNVMTRWLTFRRSPAQINNILSMNCTCSGRQSTTQIHRLGAQIVADPEVGSTLTLAQRIVQSCTRDIRKLAEERKKCPKACFLHLATRSTWPNGTEHLLPHGPEQTLRGYLSWLACDDVLSVFFVTEALLAVFDHTWAVTVLPAIKTRSLYLDAFIAAASRWDNNWNNFASGMTPVDPNVHAHHFSCILLALSAIMRILCFECSNRTAALHLFQGRQSDVLSACVRIVSTQASIGARHPSLVTIFNNRIRDHLEPVGVIFWLHFPEFLVRKSELRLLGVDPKVREPQPMTPWRTLIDFMWHSYNSQHCAAPGCTHTTETRRRSFACCTGCRWTPYCSRSCQRKAWRRDDGLQHRDVCGLLRWIRMRHDMPHRRRFIQVTRHDPALSEEETRAIVSINTHFAALTIAELSL